MVPTESCTYSEDCNGSKSMGYERRKAARYAMQIPITVSDVGNGATVDVSSSGVAFVIEASVVPGTVIDFLLRMEDTNLQCAGTVIRAERRGESSFAVATIEEFVMQTAVH